jgi:hypothetical protein
VSNSDQLLLVVCAIIIVDRNSKPEQEMAASGNKRASWARSIDCWVMA